MFETSKVMWRLIILLTLCGWSYALTERELKIVFLKSIIKCAKDKPIDVGDLVLLQQLLEPKKTETKCLLACAYRTCDMMTPDGLYNLEGAYKVAEMIKDTDEKRFGIAKKIADICVKLNEIQVSDGDKGCERASMIFKCTVENAYKFGLSV